MWRNIPAVLIASSATFQTAPLKAQLEQVQAEELPKAEPTVQPYEWFYRPDITARVDRQGQVGFRLIVDSDGLVEHCEVTRPSIHPALNERTCALATRNARFTRLPSRGRRPDSRVFEDVVNWAAPVELVSGQVITWEDMPDLRPRSIPYGSQGAAIFYYLTIDPEGKATGCSIAFASRYEASACAAIMQIAKQSQFSTGFYGFDEEPVMRSYCSVIIWSLEALPADRPPECGYPSP